MRARWILRAVALALVAATAGVAAVAWSSRTELDDAKAAVDAAWRDLKADLEPRFRALGVVNDAVRDQGGGSRAIVGEIDAALLDWDAAVRSDAELDVQIGIANRLEGLAQRLGATIAASPRFGVEVVLEPYAGFVALRPDPTVMNQRIDQYADDLGGTLRRAVASMLGHDELPRLEVPEPPG